MRAGKVEQVDPSWIERRWVSADGRASVVAEAVQSSSTERWYARITTERTSHPVGPVDLDGADVSNGFGTWREALALADAYAQGFLMGGAR